MKPDEVFQALGGIGIIVFVVIFGIMLIPPYPFTTIGIFILGISLTMCLRPITNIHRTIEQNRQNEYEELRQRHAEERRLLAQIREQYIAETERRRQQMREYGRAERQQMREYRQALRTQRNQMRQQIRRAWETRGQARQLEPIQYHNIPTSPETNNSLEEEFFNREVS